MKDCCAEWKAIGWPCPKCARAAHDARAKAKEEARAGTMEKRFELFLEDLEKRFPGVVDPHSSELPEPKLLQAIDALLRFATPKQGWNVWSYKAWSTPEGTLKWSAVFIAKGLEPRHVDGTGKVPNDIEDAFMSGREVYR